MSFVLKETTRRIFLTGTLLAMGQTARADLASLEQAARKEGALTWYTSHTDGETAGLVAAAFQQQYGITVSVVRTTAQVAYQRLLQDLKSGIAQCDVFSSTDLGHDETLKTRKNFAAYTPENATALRADLAGLDPAGTYFPTLGELVIPIYNTQKVQPADAPKQWTDLLDPRWRNQVAVGHPAYSGTVGTWVVAMRKLYGWSYFERLERNRPLIGRSVNDAVGVLNAGERIVAAGPSGLSQVQAARGNPIGLVQPKDGAVLVVSPSAVMANAPHPNAARLFMEFLLSPAHAKLSQEVHRLSVRADAPLAEAERAGVIRLSTKDIVDGMPEVIEQWRDTFGS